MSMVHLSLLSIIMEYADNGDLYQKITEKMLTNQIFPEK